MSDSLLENRQTHVPTRAPTADLAPVLLRLGLGVMFVAHGLTKMFVWSLPGTARFFASVGFPGWLAYPVTVVELLGGVLLILGVQVRWIALVLGIELGFASIPHWSHGWMFTDTGGGWEYPVFLAVSAFALALAGDGRYALMPSTRLFRRNG